MRVNRRVKSGRAAKRQVGLLRYGTSVEACERLGPIAVMIGTHADVRQIPLPNCGYLCAAAERVA